MIYTLGHKANYLKAIAEQGTIQKTGRNADTCGGTVVKTLEAAQRLIREVKKEGVFTVFGVDADWEQDTEPSKNGWWHDLLRDADIIVLENIE